MKELELKYGCNPNQKPSRIYMEEGELPLTVLNGKPGYINFLDAFNSMRSTAGSWSANSSARRVCPRRRRSSMSARRARRWVCR